ncbi:MAG: transposase [Chromatiaceae bacterium]|nr:transposase [Chromatiaceae bacterium]MCF7996589.1 transposase [Chromatiaceae bacterium]MCF8003684.1 transposase [Chromatiaceae bacterium]MCF8014152.1 transposase [Chromatiaceae bacterium]
MRSSAVRARRSALLQYRLLQYRLRRRQPAQGRVMTLSGEELLPRFLLYVFPKGFMRV